MSFTVTRNRDAWFVIRGYVHQVELTIDRWLRLDVGEELELEHGEDIDIVTKWDSGGGDKERLLEQIKHLDKSITLNSAEARSAIANFVEHRTTNPTANLTFRFLTTARIGREAGPPMSRKTTGIETWEALRTGALNGSSCLAPIATIRSALKKTVKPHGFPDETWATYRRFLARARAAEMLNLILAFEWSTGQPEPEDLRDSIKRRLLANTGATDARHAEAQYQALFVRVFHELARKGQKRLTIEARDSVLARPTICEADMKILRRLDAAVRRLEVEMSYVNERLDEHELVLKDSWEAIEALAAEQGFRSTITTSEPVPDVSPPPAAIARAARPLAAMTISREFDSHAWVAVNGTSGSGKTELALLVVEHLNGQRIWLSLRDLNPPEALTRLNAAITETVGRTASVDRTPWYDAFCAALGPRGVLVMDDLPPTEPDTPLGRQLVHLATAFQRHGLKLLTTSSHPFSPRFAPRLGSILVEMPAPAFTDEEAAAVLLAHGAPPGWCDPSRVRFINIGAAGHAEMLVTAALFCRQRAWRFSEEDFQTLLFGSYTSAIQNDVMRRLLVTVPEERARQLLFRATLVFGAFSFADLQAISDIGPTIDCPRAMLAQLEGLWVQRDRKDSFRLCPLLKGFDSEIPLGTRRDIHDVLGLRIMQRGTIGPIEVHSAIAHFVVADKMDRAGTAYCLALSSLSSLEEANILASEGSLLHLWRSTALPAGMALGMRIYIRSLQVKIFNSLGWPLEFVADDFLNLAEQALEPDAWTAFTLLPVAPLLSARDFARTNRLVLKAVLGRETLKLPSGLPLRTDSGHRVDAFLWHQATLARNDDDVRVWLQSLRGLSSDKLAIMATGDAYELACIGVTDHVWMREAGKPVAERDWHAVEKMLLEIAGTATELQLDLLWAASHRARLIVFGEYCDQMDRVESIAQECLLERPHLAPCRFLLLSSLGHQFLNADRFDEAAQCLGDALRLDIQGQDVTRLLAMRELSQAIGVARPDDGLVAAEATVTFARRVRFLAKHDLAKTLGEVAIMRWLARGADAAFAPLDEAAELMLGCKSDKPEWKAAMVVLAQVAAHLSSLAAYGRAPRVAPGAKYNAPTAGLFFTYHSERHTLYTPEQDAAICWLLAVHADAAGNDQAAVRWAARRRAVDDQDGASWGLSQNILLSELLVRRDLAAVVGGVIASPEPENALRMSFLTICVALAADRLSDPASARGRAEELVETLRAAARARRETSVWNEAADIVESAFCVDTTLAKQELFEGAFDPGVELSMQLAIRFCISAHNDRGFGDALGDQIVLAQFQLSHLAIFRPAYRRLFLPFLEQFWCQALERSAFHFRSAAMVRERIVASRSVPVLRRAQVIIREIVWALNVCAPPGVAEWLRG